MVKWTGVLITVVTVALVGLANLLVTTMTRHSVPEVINIFAAGTAVVAAIVAFVAHLYGRLDAKIDLIIELLVGRFDDMESRLGDRNSGFVEGYLLSHAPSANTNATVLPLNPRTAMRRAATSDD
jgi:hypothetical protein